tara:strand:+ start:191742 stop:193643 length:1902 start_codon:yes stop_codon:yes gene_type:complete
MNILSLFDGMSCGQIALKRLDVKVDKFFSSEIDKHCIKVTQHNHPNTIQLGDVRELDGTTLPKIDLLMGGSPCFTSGNLVMTTEGYKDIKDIKVGDKVLTHRGRYKHVIRIGNEIKPTLRVKAQGSTEIITTQEHPFYSIRRKNRNYSEPIWKNIGEFDKEDKSLSLKWKINKDDGKFSDTDLYILGRFVADGCCWRTKRKNRKNSYQHIFKISCGKHEIEDFKSKVDDRFSYREERTVYNAFIYKQEWYELGKLFGHGAGGKFFPNFILDLPVERLKIFINGYMDGDGNKNPNNYNRGTTISEKLALTLSLAIQKCYYGVSIFKNNRPKTTIIEGRTVNQNDDYQIDFTMVKNKSVNYVMLNNYVGYNIKHENTNLNEVVYNIEVKDDNSYMVNNLIVHNCQGFSFSGKQLNFDDPRSKLFFEFVRVLKETKPKYFLLENVVMKKEFQDIITEHMGVEPIEINSNLVSAQNRRRLYWTNIPNIVQPEDKGIDLVDILEETDFTSPSAIRGRRLNKATIIGRRVNERGKRDDYNKQIPISQCLEVRKVNTNKSNCLTTVAKDNVLTTMPIGRHLDAFKNKLPFRYYTVKEYCRLQTVPDDYFEGVASDNQTRKMLGNGWTVDVITHILKNIES